MKFRQPRATHVRFGKWLAFGLIFLAMPLAAIGQDQGNAVDLTHLTVPHELDGPWRVHAGDDPDFAKPNYDDSQWSEFNPHTSLRTVIQQGEAEIVWYRQRVHVDPHQTGLALREQTLSRAFEIYVNGEMLMQSGSVAPYSACTYDALLLRRIPDDAIATGTLEIALRVRIGRGEWADTNPGLFATNLAIGQESTLSSEDWLTVIGENFFPRLDSALDIAVGFVALFLFLSQRRQTEYFYIFILGMIRLAELPVQLATLFINIPVGWRFLNAFILIPTPFAWTAMYFAFVNRRISPKLGIFFLLAGILNGYNTLHDLVPQLQGSYVLLTNLPFVILLSIVVPTVLAIDWYRGNKEAGILLIPAIFFSLYIYADYTLALLLPIPGWRAAATRGLNLMQSYALGPFIINIDNLSGIFSTLSLAIIMVLRSSTTSRRQALLEGELEAARQVQQVILPEQIGAIAGFAIESVYEPAQQVGGDFFQILPASDGGLLLVLGDVAGKGLPAAMLVSMLIGAVRTVINFTEEPDRILASLNERLIGRSGGGFSTALAVHFSREGLVTIANAGQLNPYIDGIEMDLPGALPLGILSGTNYEAIRFQLGPGSRMIFYSDGVIEAQNRQGELLGFERGREMSTQSAVTIVAAAKLFGQSDDITVVAITRGSSVVAASAA